MALGRDPGRGDRDEDDHRRLPGAQGRARAGHVAAPAADGGRLLMPREVRHRDARLRVHRRVPHAGPALRRRAPGSWPTGAPAPERRDGVRRPVRQPRRSTRSRPSAPTPRSTSSSSRCRTTSMSRPSARPPRHGKGVACTKPLGRNADEAGEMLRLVERGRRLPRLPRERRLQRRDRCGCARWSRPARSAG